MQWELLKTTTHLSDMVDFHTVKTQYGAEISALRERLHRIPEPGGHEHETTALIKSAASRLPLEEVSLPGATGAAFRLRGCGSGETLCLRADIDGLSVQEPESAALRSENCGFMHACGHDHHAAGLYGAMLTLCDRRRELKGDTVFLFQPAEEPVTGARAIADSGFFGRQGIEAVFALHNMPDIPAGEISLSAGPVMAAKDSFEIKIYGSGGHGAMPQLCRDPIVAAAEMVMSLQTAVSRSISPLESAVVSVCSINGGNGDNCIGDVVTMRGSVRSLEDRAREAVLRRMEEICRHVAQAHGCDGKMSLAGGVPALVNAPELYGRCFAAAEAVGTRVSPARPVMISEDFACYGAVVPGFYYFLGSGRAGEDNAPLHSSAYLAHQDTAVYAAALLANTVLHN